MGEPIISVSGLRGVVGETLTPELAMRFACTFAGLAPPGPIVLTRDGRASGTMLADAIRGGLAAVGRDVLDVGVAATPTTGVLVRQVPAAGGIQVSASHNPAQYNGLKLFSAEGRVLSAAAG
ncbi:MAG: phosphoglucosamine mutase, partial [Pirellulales bacterium]